MKKLLWLAFLLPFYATAQISAPTQKIVGTGIIRANAGSSGLDTLLVTNGPGVNGYVPVYNSTLKKSVFINPATFASGMVTSVSGTTNRITSTGGSTPVIDISSAYVGQTSITTLGTVTTGTWNGSVIGSNYGGAGTINGVLKANGSGVVSLATSSDLPGGPYLPLSGGTLTGTTNISTGNFSLTASSGDQFFSSNLSSSARRRGLFISDGSTINMQVYTGGGSTLGAFTESPYLMVYGTGGAGGGGGTEVHLWHSTGKGNMFSMNANTSTNTSYFPLVVSGAVTASGGFVGNASTATSAATLTTTRTIFGQNFNGSANVSGAATFVGIANSGAYTQTGSNTNTFSGDIRNTSTTFLKGQTAIGTYDGGADVPAQANYALTLGAGVSSGTQSLYTYGSAYIGGALQAAGAFTGAAGTFSSTLGVTGALTGTTASFTGLLYVTGALSSTMAQFRSNNGAAASITFGSSSGGGSDNYGIDHTIIHGGGGGYTISHNATTRNIRMIAGSGGVELAGTATSWAAISDMRFKTKVENIGSVLDGIKKNTPFVGYLNTNTEKTPNYMLSAQELLKTFPHVVNIGSDKDKTLSVRYSELIPVLFKALQETTARIEALEANQK